MSRYSDSSHMAHPLLRRIRRLSRFERREEARHFVSLFHRENDLPGSNETARWREVARDLDRHGFYRHTPEELAFGARVAWRNSARCIGRATWKALDVIDCRNLTHPDEIAAQLAQHSASILTGRQTPSRMTIFAPIEGEALPAYVENAQVIQFAGYPREEAPPLGDPQNVELTRISIALGWRPPSTPTPFDVLPLVVRDASGRRHVYEIPPEATKLIDVAHPQHPGLTELGLRWYAVPIVSDMILTIGGVDYPCAPFNGHYMSTEIACRNLLDEDRYDLSQTVRNAIGGSPDDPFWRDRVVLSLNEAIVQSFRTAGISIVDPHTASEQYIEFCNAEHKGGRLPSGDWAWIVPPTSASTCPVFHLEMTDHHDVPNFYRSRATDGAALAPSYANTDRGPIRTRIAGFRRRVLRRLSNAYW